MSLTCRTMARHGRIESVRVWRICGGALVGSEGVTLTLSSHHKEKEGKGHQALVRIHHPNPILTLALRHAVHVFLGAMPVNVKGRTWAREQCEKRSGQRRASPSRRRWGVVVLIAPPLSSFSKSESCAGLSVPAGLPINGHKWSSVLADSA
jgi:hypothetical protein